jgi:GT2 family glycosyltransferase
MSSADVPLTASVVIPTYQRRDALARLLRALARQSIPHSRYEAVVIVDGSADGTCEMLAALAPPLRLAWHAQPNAGRAVACNHGIRLARHELVILLDDDMEPTPGWLEAHCAAHADGAPRAVMGAVPVKLATGASGAARYVARKFERHLQTLATPGRPVALREFYSGNLSIPRGVLQRVGGFDEAFRVYGNEDLELYCRLRSAGVTITFSPTPLACQYYTKDFPELARDNVAKGMTAVLLATKHPEAASELKLSARHLGSRWRRGVLKALVCTTRRWPVVLRGVARTMRAASRMNAPLPDTCHALAADYFFLLGAIVAWSEVGGASVRMNSGRR